MKNECTNELSRLPIRLTTDDLTRLLPIHWDEVLPSLRVYERRVYLAANGVHEECPFKKRGLCQLNGERPEACNK